MLLSGTIKKHQNLLKEPTFFETFLWYPSAQYESFYLKSSFLLLFAKRIVFQAMFLI